MVSGEAPPVKRVLILGGTQEAALLAAQCTQLPGVDVISSLAGRLQRPTLPAGTVRQGGFGGVAGLVEYIREQHIAVLLDATHPFAADISWHAAEAAQVCRIPHLMLVRPPWEPTAADHWLAVASLVEAATLLPAIAQRAFLSIGRQELPVFAQCTHLWFLMRMIEPPASETPLPPGLVLLQRGPFAVADERVLFQTHTIGALVSKNSGGQATAAKLLAARELGIPVVMVQRPALPAGVQVADVAQARLWMQQYLI